MTKLEFLRYMKVLKSFCKRSNNLSKAMASISDSSVGGIGGWLVDAYVELLEKQCGDKSGWISWWVFENDWGRKRLRATIDGSPIDVHDLNDLWRVIQKV